MPEATEENLPTPAIPDADHAMEKSEDVRYPLDQFKEDFAPQVAWARENHSPLSVVYIKPKNPEDAEQVEKELAEDRKTAQETDSHGAPALAYVALDDGTFFASMVGKPKDKLREITQKGFTDTEGKTIPLDTEVLQVGQTMIPFPEDVTDLAANLLREARFNAAYKMILTAAHDDEQPLIVLLAEGENDMQTEQIKSFMEATRDELATPETDQANPTQITHVALSDNQFLIAISGKTEEQFKAMWRDRFSGAGPAAGYVSLDPKVRGEILPYFYNTENNFEATTEAILAATREKLSESKKPLETKKTTSARDKIGNYIPRFAKRPHSSQPHIPLSEERAEVTVQEPIVTTADLIRDEPANKFEQPLREKGIPLDVPERFLDTTNLPDGTHIDPRTGLPIEDGAFRTALAEQFSDCIRRGKNWMMIYADVDNLKSANTKHGREFGDMVIKYGAAQITKALTDIPFSEETQIIATRQTGAADETVVWLFDISDEQISQIERNMASVNEPVTITDPPFTFSTSAVALPSRDNPMQAEIESARTYLGNNPTAIAYNEYQQIKNLGDSMAHAMKEEKDQERMPREQLAAADSQEATAIIVESLGDSRIGNNLLREALDIVGNKTVSEMQQLMTGVLDSPLSDQEKVEAIRKLTQELAAKLQEK